MHIVRITQFPPSQRCVFKSAPADFSQCTHIANFHRPPVDYITAFPILPSVLPSDQTKPNQTKPGWTFFRQDNKP